MTQGSRAGMAIIAIFAWLTLSAFEASAADTVHKDAGIRAAQLADIKVVRTQYLPKEMAYSPATRALAEAQLDKLERQAGSLSPAQFLVGLAQAGALTDNAHSGLRVSDPQASFKARLPVRLLWFPDQLIVARAYGMAADLAGARVIKIEGRSPEALYEASKVLLGGSDAGRKHWLNQWIESAGVLHALGVAKSPDRLSLTVQLLNGTTVERTLPMLPIADTPPTAESVRLWSPEHVTGEHGWSSALGPAELPLYLRDADRPFRSVDLPELHTLYLQFRWNQDDEGFPIAKFLESVQKQIDDTHPTHLVMDLRFDVGGNILTTLDFMRHIAASVRGRTFLLVGPYTFSAGIVSAAAVKKHGAERVTVIGDVLGDRLNFWSEGNSFELPHSHYTFRYTDGQFNLLHGCTAEPRCMDDLYPVNVNGASLVPEIHTPLTSVDYFARRDPAMEAVAAALTERAVPRTSP
jgi:hypothetical protein